MLSLLVQKNTSATLQRIMRIVLILGMFYIGWPSTTYLMIKGANGMEVTLVQQLSMFSYAFVPQIPISILIFSLQSFYRVKYFLLLVLWVVSGYYIYKSSHETRAKHFDFQANKQMAWMLMGSSLVYLWLYKSYFLQV